MTLIPVDALVDVMGEATAITVERFGTATPDARGELSPGAGSTFTARMVVHQGDPEAVTRAGLDHNEDWRVFYSKTALRVAGAAGPADVVQYVGERFELVKLEDYLTLGGIVIAWGKRINQP